MEQYILKSAVVAEIERIKNTEYNGIFINDDVACCALDMAIDAINTLEVKEVNLESLVRQVIDLYLEAGELYNSVIKEERKEHGGSDLAIKLLSGIIDAKELSIQYVLNI